MTVTVKAVPAVWAVGVPVLPLALPGAAVSPGSNNCNFRAAGDKGGEPVEAVGLIVPWVMDVASIWMRPAPPLPPPPPGSVAVSEGAPPVPPVAVKVALLVKVLALTKILPPEPPPLAPRLSIVATPAAPFELTVPLLEKESATMKMMPPPSPPVCPTKEP